LIADLLSRYHIFLEVLCRSVAAHIYGKRFSGARIQSRVGRAPAHKMSELVNAFSFMHAFLGWAGILRQHKVAVTAASKLQERSPKLRDSPYVRTFVQSDCQNIRFEVQAYLSEH